MINDDFIMKLLQLNGYLRDLFSECINTSIDSVTVAQLMKNFSMTVAAYLHGWIKGVARLKPHFRQSPHGRDCAKISCQVVLYVGNCCGFDWIPACETVQKTHHPWSHSHYCPNSPTLLAFQTNTPCLQKYPIMTVINLQTLA